MRILQVSEFLTLVNDVLRETLSGGEVFAVEGEISSFRVSQGQWVSFDLKDATSLVNVFMPLRQLTVPLEDGFRVRVFGLPRIYLKYGKFSLSATRIELAGEGALRKALALLRANLAAEGLFDLSRKRPLPQFPQRIALIASRDSAAYGDFIRIVEERWGGLEIDLYHVLVQGDRAAEEIVQAIQEVNHSLAPSSLEALSHKVGGGYDVLVLTRGGGSLEELMAFNDERVVRALYASKIPTLVAIGHERDVTFAEEVADVRGSTPTDCARRLVPDRRDALYEVATLTDSIASFLTMRLERCASILERAMAAPSAWISGRVVELETLSSRNVMGVRQWVASVQDALRSHLRLLLSLDPNNVLARGYAIIRTEAGRTISSVKQAHVGDAVVIRLKDGEIGAQVTQRARSYAKKRFPQYRCLQGFCRTRSYRVLV